MSSHPSNSDSRHFEKLDERIRRWIWQKGWTSLRDAQERAIPALIDADRDVIVAAATAAGKTEAAFLPILTNLLASPKPGAVLYISPLKALINDQWDRLNGLCEALEIPVTGWHGDVNYSSKSRFLKNPSGILLITPESLEALFVNRGASIPGLMAYLRYVVIDELHAFIGDERGKQLQSLMHRVEIAIGRVVPRVGLSATLGDMHLASCFLRPAKPDGVELIESKDGGQDLKVMLKGYIDAVSDQNAETDDDDPSTPYAAICDHMYKVLKGTNNLVFPNSRSSVEKYTDRLRRLCERDKVPNQFWAHHGSLSKAYREETEQALKSGEAPATAICTSTLELGIDIGAVKCICQIGRPPAVSSLRQRLGRSGRRKGESAILRGYLIEPEVGPKTSLADSLREGLVQSIAMVRLLIDGWFEPPRVGGIHGSTLVQQIMSLIAERGGADAKELWRTLLAPGAPFAGMEREEYLQLLKQMGTLKMLVQDSSGLLLHGEVGEKIVNHYDFYASFVSDEEYRLICGSTQVGLIPVTRPLVVGQKVIFAGRRWLVQDVSEEKKSIYVTPSKGGSPPVFDNCSAVVHERVRQEMKTVLSGDFHVPFLDANAQELLAEGRENFSQANLNDESIIEVSSCNSLLFTWSGDLANDALVLLLQRQGLEATNEGLSISVPCSRSELLDALNTIANDGVVTPDDLLRNVQNLSREKWDWVLPGGLLRKSYASLHLDIEGAKRVAGELSKAHKGQC
ncbi:DEAD/DEAH box helicase [Aeromonas veronii]|uniref:DEAD/DEAH box helicase n=2 Tax=Aeromonas veronii TaxID=654 RepID=A0A4S5CKH1_AERVE|nr:DEAD/DEAH box helicase [Aeromonas veronii]